MGRPTMSEDNAEFADVKQCGWCSAFGHTTDEHNTVRPDDPRPTSAGQVEDLIERSSLGTPEAKALRATVSDEHAARIVERAQELERDEKDALREARILANCVNPKHVESGDHDTKGACIIPDPSVLEDLTDVETLALDVAERERAAAEKAWDEGASEGLRTKPSLGYTLTNPYRQVSHERSEG